MPLTSLTETLVERLRELVVEHPGPVPVHPATGSEGACGSRRSSTSTPAGGFVGALQGAVRRQR